MSNRHKIFNIYQRKKTIEFDETDVKIDMWKPSAKTAKKAARYLLDRSNFWENKKDGFIDYATKFGEQFKGKEELIERIMNETISQDIFKAQFDLLDDKVSRKFYFDFIDEYTLNKLAKDYVVSGLTTKREIQSYLDTHKTSFVISDFCKMFEKKEELKTEMDAYLERKVKQRYMDKEKKEYEKKDVDELKNLLSLINLKTISFTLAYEEYLDYMLARVCREHTKSETEMGNLIFSDDEDSEDYVGELSPEALNKLVEELNEYISLESAENVRRQAEDINFQKPTT